VNYHLGDNSTVYYLVDDNGNIDFPVLGKLHISGMTKGSMQEYVASLIYPRYLTEKPDVECRIENFRVYCIGDFNSPGVIQATNGRLNLIEAIAMCHDLAVTGERDNIMLIRTDASGQRYVKRVNLNDANFMTMPEFELQQNDILYVQPNKYKKRSVWQVPPMVTFGITLLGTGMSLASFVLMLTKL
jgi:polysaccharide export outer membrane protein